MEEGLLVLLGGVLTLVGSLLANYLQYRSERRKAKQARTSERVLEVRRYLVACLDFIDVISIPTALGPERFKEEDHEEWGKAVTKRLEGWESLPVAGSARVLFVQDNELLEGLNRLDTLRVLFWINYRSFIDQREMVPYERYREEARELVKRLTTRLDKLMDEAL